MHPKQTQKKTTNIFKNKYFFLTCSPSNVFKIFCSLKTIFVFSPFLSCKATIDSPNLRANSRQKSLVRCVALSLKKPNPIDSSWLPSLTPPMSTSSASFLALERCLAQSSNAQLNQTASVSNKRISIPNFIYIYLFIYLLVIFCFLF